MEALMRLIDRRMAAINASNIDGLMAVYDPWSVFVVNVKEGKARMGKDDIGKWTSHLPEYMSRIRCDYTLEPCPTNVKMHWRTVERDTGKVVNSGIDLFWG